MLDIVACIVIAGWAVLVALAARGNTVSAPASLAVVFGSLVLAVAELT